MNLVGTQLGHYRLLQFLNGGGMGEVYLAEDPSLSRQVAIKVIKTDGSLYPDSQAGQEAKRLFQREMKVIAGLDHPNILTLLEAGEQNVNRERMTYMVMPYCPAGSLADWIRRYHGNSLLSPKEISQLLKQAAGALQHAHDHHILHLDIKPQNFLVRRQQDSTALPSLLLADFGISKIANLTQMSVQARGTFAYMAPEQMESKPVAASDQYALAIMAYELLTGGTPFKDVHPHLIPYLPQMPDPPSKVNSSLPKALDKVVLRALAKKPEARYRSVQEFAREFEAALQTPEKQREREAAPRRKEAPAILEKQVVLPSQKSKNGFLWALVFGVVTGCLDFGILKSVSVYPYTYVLHALIALVVITVIASLVTARIVLRRWIGTITGFIASITFSACIVVLTTHGRLYQADFLPLGTFIAVATLLGFIGGWLGTIGRARRQV